MSNQEYMRIYPTGSAPGKIYGTTKKHKIPVKMIFTFNYI